MIVPFPNANPEQAAVGRRLHLAREARGLGLEALAEAMHVEPERLRRAEVGRERLKAVELYAAIMTLHLPMDLLFRPDGAPPGRG
jgi:transcriptional regulator with XRE-family HTH domain